MLVPPVCPDAICFPIINPFCPSLAYSAGFGFIRKRVDKNAR